MSWHTTGGVITSGFLLVILLTGLSYGGDPLEKSTSFGLKAGLISPGTQKIDDEKYSSSISLSFGASIDKKFGERTFWGAAVDFSGFRTRGETNLMESLCITFKESFDVGDNDVTLRPGVGLGFAYIFESLIDGEGIIHFFLMGTIEVIYPVRSGISMLGEINLIAAPSGETDDEKKASFGPGIIVRGGILF